MGAVMGLQLGCGDYSRAAAIMKLLQLAGGYYLRVVTIGERASDRGNTVYSILFLGPFASFDYPWYC